MNIHLVNQTELKLSRFNEDGFNISMNDESMRYSAIAMFVTSLARCTYAVLEHYATRMDITTENIVTNMTWDFIENPTRINQIGMAIYWPELPEKRIASVQRASHKCTISNTINDCVIIKTTVFNTEAD